MRFSDEFLNELKDRVRLSDYMRGVTVKFEPFRQVHEGVIALQARGKTPSFFIDDDKRILSIATPPAKTWRSDQLCAGNRRALSFV